MTYTNNQCSLCGKLGRAEFDQSFRHSLAGTLHPETRSFELWHLLKRCAQPMHHAFLRI